MTVSHCCIDFYQSLRQSHALSFLAAISLTVYLATSAYTRHQIQQDEANIEALNQKVSMYKQVVGTNPDLNLIDLYHKGYTEQRLHRTPFGGYYRFNPSQSIVYNPNNNP